MDNAGYTTLTRQSGLLREMQVVANNIANISTTGFRKEGLIFSEYVHAMENGEASLSMANANVRSTNTTQGPLTQTNSPFDLAIEGPGYFLLETPQGNQLTRAGNFTANAQGELVSMDGYRLLDNGNSPIFIPPDAKSFSISSDGSLSADGRPLSQVGIFKPTNEHDLTRKTGVLFLSTSEVEAVEDSVILQGFLEDSNVNPIVEIARMIEVQHAYELGQKLLDQEDERIRNVMQTLGR